MTETTDNGVIMEESTGKKDKKQNLWKMFRRKKGNNTTSTSQMSKLQKQNAKNTLGNKNSSYSKIIRLFYDFIIISFSYWNQLLCT